MINSISMSLLVLGVTLFSQGVDKSMLVGQWKTVRVDYLDQDPPSGKQGQNIVFEFKQDGTCINHEYGSATNYIIVGREVDMGGYKIIIEKITSKEMVFREKKDFFIRRFYCERIPKGSKRID